MSVKLRVFKKIFTDFLAVGTTRKEYSAINLSNPKFVKYFVEMNVVNCSSAESGFG
jgi:hypothetical protein